LENSENQEFREREKSQKKKQKQKLKKIHQGAALIFYIIINQVVTIFK